MIHRHTCIQLVGWLCWGLTSQSTIFQSCRDGAIASWVINQYFRGVKCLAQGHNTAEVGLEPRTSRSGVRHYTTEPPRSPLVYSGCIAFPYIMHLYTLVTLFWCFIRKYLSHTLYYAQLVSVCFTLKLFSSLKYIVYKCYSCFRQRRGHFFHRHTCIQWLHSFSLYNALYTLVTLFLVLHQKIFVPYIILLTACLSLFHTESMFVPLNYIVYRCYSCIQTKTGSFFSSSHLYTVVA